MRRGFTLVELMVGLIVFAVILAGAFTMFISMWDQQGYAVGFPESQQGAQAIVFTVAQAFQNATLCGTSDSGCVSGSAIQNASSTACTIYSRNSSGTLVQTTFANNSGSFQMTSGGTTTTISQGATVTFTYYTSSNYNATSLTTFTPSSSNEMNLIGVGISVNVAEGGGNNTYTTYVRLRNGP